MKLFLRLFLAAFIGNLLGYGLFRFAAWITPQIWDSGPPSSFGMLLIRIGITAMAFATPPVIIGALAARIAGRYTPWVGLASAAWGLTARQWWPATVPLLPPESWVAPLMLILLSGLVGGWLGGGRLPVSGDAFPQLSDAVQTDSSKDSVI